MSKLETNVLILGQSGVGKSSLINYIYGFNSRETGTGKPVTGEGLYKVKLEKDNMIINLYDSWGLEANKTDKWTEIILDEVKKHNDSMEIKDWFHTIIYCLSIQKSRVEKFEIEEIINPLIKQGNRIIIALTHADVLGSDEKSKGIIEYLLRETNLSIEDIIKVSNEEKELLGGKKTKKFGKDEIIIKMKENLWVDIKQKLCINYENYLNQVFLKWKNDIYRRVISSPIRWFGTLTELVIIIGEKKQNNLLVDEVNKSIEGMMDLLVEKTKEFLFNSYRYYYELYNQINLESKIDFSEFMIEIDRLKLKKFEYKIKDYILDSIPIINILFLGNDKKIILEKINDNYELLLKTIPQYRNNLKVILDSISAELYLLEMKYKEE